MKQLTIWMRVGVTMTLDLPDNATEQDIIDAAEKMVSENDPAKHNFHFNGDCYAPAEDESEEIAEKFGIDMWEFGAQEIAFDYTPKSIRI